MLKGKLLAITLAMVKALFITLFGSAFFSCALTPMVYDLITSLLGYEPWPFSRVFDRVFLALLVIFIIFFRRDFDIACIYESLRNPAENRVRFYLVVLGIAISSVSVGICTIGVFQSGALTVNPRTNSEILGRLARVVPGALLIAIIEELFFRVLLLRRLRDYLPVSLAVAATSLMYALVHFITPKKSFVYSGRSWFDGFDYLPALLGRLLEPGTGLGIAGLFVVGLLLSYAMLRLGSVYLAIGLHAGWICALKMISYLSWRNPTMLVSEGLGGRYALFSQGWTWVSFVMVFALLYIWARKSNNVRYD